MARAKKEGLPTPVLAFTVVAFAGNENAIRKGFLALVGFLE